MDRSIDAMVGGWMDGERDVWSKEWLDGCREGGMEGWMGGGVDGWMERGGMDGGRVREGDMDGWMDGWMGGWMNGQAEPLAGAQLITSQRSQAVCP